MMTKQNTEQEATYLDDRHLHVFIPKSTKDNSHMMKSSLCHQKNTQIPKQSKMGIF